MILLIIILILFSTGFSNGNLYRQYCANSCVTPKGTFKHTVCERASVKCRPGLGCGTKARPSMTDELRQAILDKHNELRNKIAMGEEKTGSQPSASNMNVLNYNFELEFIAQCLANTCDFNHDKCRNGLNLIAGQNLGIQSHTGPDFSQLVSTSLKTVQNWYDEVGKFMKDEIDSFNGGQQGTGHYTQMVWADIEYIGCGRTIWYSKGWYTMYLVCNYGGKKTGGNLMQAPMYKKGDPCSNCPADKPRNDKYKGLCGNVIPVTEVDRGAYGKASSLKFITIFGTNIKRQDASVCLVLIVWCLFTKMLL